MNKEMYISSALEHEVTKLKELQVPTIVCLTPDQMADRLKNMLEMGIVSFSFRKADGSIRQAIGTLSKTMMPPKGMKHFEEMKVKMKQVARGLTGLTDEAVPTNVERIRAYVKACAMELDAFVLAVEDEGFKRAPNPEMITYFDIEAGAFRSFKKYDIVCIK